MKYFVVALFLFSLISCSSSINTFKKDETNKISVVKYGVLKSSIPVKIKSDGIVGALLGGVVGGIIGAGDVLNDKNSRDSAEVYGAVVGALIGYVTATNLGSHDGFQYIIDIDNSNKDSAFVQGDIEAIPDGQKVVILYGEDVRILPFEE